MFGIPNTINPNNNKNEHQFIKEKYNGTPGPKKLKSSYLTQIEKFSVVI